MIGVKSDCHHLTIASELFLNPDYILELRYEG